MPIAVVVVVASFLAKPTGASGTVEMNITAPLPTELAMLSPTTLYATTLAYIDVPIFLLKGAA